MYNIRSLRNKLDHIVEILLEFNLDILCLTETWLFPSDIGIIRAALPSSFSIFHVPRGLVDTGGGVAVIYSSALNMKHEESLPQVASFELIKTKFTCHNETVHIYVVYRPGHSGTDRAFIEEFGSFLEDLLGIGGKILICGDFNYWVDEPLSKPYSMDFLELLEIHNFKNHIAFSTHLLGHTLDLVLSLTDSDFVKDIEGLPIDNDISDHALLIFSLVVARPKAMKKSITFRSYRNIDQDNVANDIMSVLARVDPASSTAEHLALHYNESLKSLEERCFPLIAKEILVKPNSPWYDHTIVLLRRQRRKSERKWRRCRTEPNWLEYKAAVVDQVRQCKVRFYQNEWASCRGDQRKLFLLVGRLMNGCVPALLPSSESDNQLASDFMNFFQSKIDQIRVLLDGTVDDMDFLVAVPPRDPPASLFIEFSPVNELTIRKYIRELNKTYCSLDPVNIPKIAKAFESTSSFIAALVNLMFAESSFVRSEKLGLLRPKLKRAGLDIEDMKNYRPVSNLSFLSKIIEHAMLDQLRPFLDENNLVSRYQSAYREFHSTETALCRIYNDLVTSVCSGKACLLVMLDLSAAFDTIDHHILLADLYSFGIQGDAHLLFQSYFECRFQRVVIGEALSEPEPLRFGVPQGSVLGPVLFILYTSSLADLLEAHGVSYHFYADDTQIYIEISDVMDVKEKMLSLLHDIKIWMLHRKLKLNDGKTEVIVVKGGLRSNIEEEFGSLNLGAVQLHPSVSVKNLGVLFDSNLNFKYHVSSLVKNCNFHIRNLYAVRRYLSKDALIALVHSLIVSRIDYCNVLFLGLPSYILKKLQSVMNRCARLIFSLPPRVPTTRSLIELHWLPIRARVEFKVCLIVFKALKFNQPKYIVDLLSYPDNGNHVTLRSSDDPYRLFEPRAVHEKAFAERSFVYVAPRLYNKLPIQVKQQTSLQSFKIHLKSFLFLQAYDTTTNSLREAYKL